MRHALNVLAEVAPDWLVEQMKPEWAKLYRSRFSDFRLPKEEKARVTLAEEIGMDGRDLARKGVCEHKSFLVTGTSSDTHRPVYLDPTISCK